MGKSRAFWHGFSWNQQSLFRWPVFIALALLSGCSLLTTQPVMTTSDRWAVVPMINQTDKPIDMAQLESHLFQALSETGINDASLYTEPAIDKKAAKDISPQAITDIKRRQQARQWMQDNHITYALSGELLTWGKDKQGRPSVTINLSVTDSRTGREIWVNSGYSEGRPQDSDFQVAQQLMSSLLKQIPIQNKKDHLPSKP